MLHGPWIGNKIAAKIAIAIKHAAVVVAQTRKAGVSRVIVKNTKNVAADLMISCLIASSVVVVSWVQYRDRQAIPNHAAKTQTRGICLSFVVVHNQILEQKATRNATLRKAVTCPKGSTNRYTAAAKIATA